MILTPAGTKKKAMLDRRKSDFSCICSIFKINTPGCAPTPTNTALSSATRRTRRTSPASATSRGTTATSASRRPRRSASRTSRWRNTSARFKTGRFFPRDSGGLCQCGAQGRPGSQGSGERICSCDFRGRGSFQRSAAPSRGVRLSKTPRRAREGRNPFAFCLFPAAGRKAAGSSS